MSTLYVAKSFGRYFFFKTEEARNQYLDSLPEWERKHCELSEQLYGKVV